MSLALEKRGETTTKRTKIGKYRGIGESALTATAKTTLVRVSWAMLGSKNPYLEELCSVGPKQEHNCHEIFLSQSSASSSLEFRTRSAKKTDCKLSEERFSKQGKDSYKKEEENVRFAGRTRTHTHKVWIFFCFVCKPLSMAAAQRPREPKVVDLGKSNQDEDEFFFFFLSLMSLFLTLERDYTARVCPG